MTGPDSPKSGTQKAVKVKTVVKEYLDTIWADVFPDIAPDREEPSLETLQAPVEETQIPETPLPQTDTPKDNHLEDTTALVNEIVEKPESDPVIPKPSVVSPVVAVNIQPDIDVKEEPQAKIVKEEVNETLSTVELTEPEPEVELKYPQAPPWAQAGFAILLFNVCGLKLAVSMEALGRIIKVEHETSQIIGKPDWFIGAYHESDQHLYVVDTAKFIMPEKGYDLTELGFNYIIQLQRSDWTLACKEVYKTIRITPDQVKWRSQKGKRQWLAGTVIEHMCALIHVDSLVELLQEQAN